jgi:Serine carboxypeptidase
MKIAALYPLAWLLSAGLSSASASASAKNSEPDKEAPQVQRSSPHLRRSDPLASAAGNIVNSPSEDEDDDGNSGDNNVPAESSCNRASSLEECRTLTDDESSEPCQWCVAGAIPSECMSPQQASMLPSGVFECSTPGFTGLNNKNLLEFGQVTVQVRSQEVTEAEFCDASSKQISGYMDLKGSKYDENGEAKHLFFWMFERRPQDDQVNFDATDIPFVVWLTGGPGCSSTLALLTENGPCTVNNDGKTTTVNPFSWTEAAHVLWLDQPAGVGYSYGSADDSDEEMVAEDAYWFLQAFFKTYPEYAFNPLYIIGESYAGTLLKSHSIFAFAVPCSRTIGQLTFFLRLFMLRPLRPRHLAPDLHRQPGGQGRHH